MPFDPIYTTEHELFRETCRRFLAEEVVPYQAEWEKAGIVPRALWTKAAELGLLLPTTAEEYGGAGADFGFCAVFCEEVMRANAAGAALGMALHNDICAPYIEKYGTQEQKQRWLPAMAKGDVISAIAMSEPAAGSDLQGVKTRAVRDGDDYVITGQKTFITNGQHADVVIVVCKTDPEKGAKGTSLILVETDRPGFARGRNLDKLGMKAQDTSELFFDSVRVPVSNRLGEEDQGFRYLMEQLPRERLQAAVQGLAAAEAALDWTVAYTREREAFGQKVFDFQNTQFKLADIKTECLVARAFVEKCIALQAQDGLTQDMGAAAKLYCSELQGRATDECLQLHGGYGFMAEYPITKLYADSRVNRIYAGSSEIMRLIVARSL